MKKRIYKDTLSQNKCNTLIKEFKERTLAALNNPQFIKHSLKNAKKHKKSRVFAQNLFRHVKIADFISVYNQFVLI